MGLKPIKHIIFALFLMGNLNFFYNPDQNRFETKLLGTIYLVTFQIILICLSCYFMLPISSLSIYFGITLHNIIESLDSLLWTLMCVLNSIQMICKKEQLRKVLNDLVKIEELKKTRKCQESENFGNFSHFILFWFFLAVSLLISVIFFFNVSRWHGLLHGFTYFISTMCILMPITLEVLILYQVHANLARLQKHVLCENCSDGISTFIHLFEKFLAVARSFFRVVEFSRAVTLLLSMILSAVYAYLVVSKLIIKDEEIDFGYNLVLIVSYCFFIFLTFVSYFWHNVEYEVSVNKTLSNNCSCYSSLGGKKWLSSKFK